MSEMGMLSSVDSHVDSGLMNLVTNLEKVSRYLESIENGDFAYIADLFSPDAVLEQLPNRIYPHGIKSGISTMAEAFEKGRKLLSSQSYEIKSFVVDGDWLSVEVLWTGTLALAFGSLAVGSQMRAHSAMFFQFKDGKIVSQHNYDCFEPW
jgi:ketosteroid isomerase-like protein